MRASLICSATLFSLACFSFATNKGDISEDTLAEYVALAARIARESKVKRDSSRRAFDADAQRISTTGEHAYVRTIVFPHGNV
jgi:hypothetical protein